MGENFCLRWNDHHDLFFSTAESLCHSSLLTDVVLSAGGSLFQVTLLLLLILLRFLLLLILTFLFLLLLTLNLFSITYLLF